MHIIDLSHRISDSMPFFPGTESPSLTESSTIPEQGYLEKKLSILTHTGTHIDAPAHIYQGDCTIDNIELDQFFGSAIVLDFSCLKKKTIGFTDIEPYKEVIEEIDFVLFNTGWYRYWGTENYFKDFPTLSKEAALCLCDFKLKGIGIDTISVDSMLSSDYPIHKIILGNHIGIIENLNSLDRLPAGRFFFCCFPLNIQDGDGSPVRAAAITELQIQKG